MTKILKISDNNVISEAVRVLESGGVILYPTDTVYGLGADATNPKAIEKVFLIKKRSPSQPISIVVSNKSEISKWAKETKLSKKLAEKFLPGPLTLVLEHKNNLPENLIAGKETIGIRIPDNNFCLNLAKKFGKPFTTTSANISGKKTDTTIYSSIQKLSGIDLAIDAGELSGEASTVVDARGNETLILREGEIVKF